MKKATIRIKRHSIFFLLLLVFLFGTLFFFSQNNQNPNIPKAVSDPKLLLGQVLSCPPGENSASYDCTVALISSYINTNDIDAFSQLVERESQTNPKVGSYCHAIGHSIGRALYQKYGYVDSLNKCSAFCAAGCTMGVMEGFLFANQAIDPTTELIVNKADTACNEYAQGDPVKHSACIHGTGHGLLPLVQYNTQNALRLCTMLPSDKGSCYDAVFMEKFLPTDPSRKIAKITDLYEYCSGYESDEELKKRCYGYLPYAWKEWGMQPDEILRRCSRNQTNKPGCARALVRIYLPGFVKSNDRTFFQLYQNASPEIQNPMVRYGAIHMVEYLPAKANLFCSLLGEANEDCKNQIQEIARLMEVTLP
jgi:hypothetical protein